MSYTCPTTKRPNCMPSILPCKAFVILTRNISPFRIESDSATRGMPISDANGASGQTVVCFKCSRDRRYVACAGDDPTDVDTLRSKESVGIAEMRAVQRGQG